MPVSKEDFEAILLKVTEVAAGVEALVYCGFLTQNYKEEDDYKDDMKCKILKAFLNNNEDFLSYLKQIIVVSGEPETITQNIEHMYHSMCLKLNNKHIDKPGINFNPKTGLVSFGTIASSKTITSLSPDVLAKIVGSVGDVITIETPGCLQEIIQPCIKKLNIIGPKAGVVLALAYMTYEGVSAIYRWSREEISGERCVQRILTSATSATATYYGGLGGAALATRFALGPWGILLAGLAAGIAAGVTAAKLTEMAVLWGLNIPKDEAVEQAYKSLGVSKNADNKEINEAFYRMCRVCHPDKPGGSHDSFIKLQTQMTLIRVARKECIA